MNSYSYNTLSELNQIQQQSQLGGNAVAPKSIYFGLDAIGDVTEIDRANAVTIGPYQNGPGYSLLSYSATTGLLTGINHEHLGASLDDLGYTYDPLARVQTFSTIDGTATYGYDPTSQLTSTTYVAASGHTEPPNFAVTFDPNGNRTSANGTSTTVGADNHLASDGTFNFTYDASGNVSTRTRISNDPANDYKTVYDWDYRNRLTDVEFYDNAGTLTQHVHYVYDVWDELIERDLDPNGSGTYTQMVHYVWDGGENGPGQGNIVLAFSGGQQLTARYLNGPNTSAFDQYFTTLAEEDVTSTTSPGTVTYPLLDQQGSVTDIIDADGVLLDHIVNEATGALFSESNPSVTHIGAFQGGYFDPLTGFVKLGERWLDTFDATWTSPDPIGLAGGDTDMTRVEGNDPANLTDRSGEVVPALIGIGIAAGWYFFGTGQTAHAPMEDNPELRHDIDQREQSEGISTTVSLITLPVGGGAYGAGARLGGNILTRSVCGGVVGGITHQATSDALTGVLDYQDGGGMSGYRQRGVINVAGSYAGNAAAWAGGGLVAETLINVGGKIFRVRYSGRNATPEVVGEVDPATLPPGDPVLTPPEASGSIPLETADTAPVPQRATAPFASSPGPFAGESIPATSPAQYLPQKNEPQSTGLACKPDATRVERSRRARKVATSFRITSR